MPWDAHPIPNAERREISSDIHNEPERNPGEHLWVANVAFGLSKAEVLAGIEQDTPPHLTPDKVISITVRCGYCLVEADGNHILAVNDACPGHYVVPPDGVVE